MNFDEYFYVDRHGFKFIVIVYYEVILVNLLNCLEATDNSKKTLIINHNQL